MLPKIATDMPATMMVVFVAPSHTIRRGARADFGRLFKTTRYGSRISESLLLNQRATAARILTKVTRKKLASVSYKVTPMWRKMLPSLNIPQKQRAIFDGLLKMNESMIPTFAVNSQINRKLKRIRILEMQTIRWCFLC